MTPHGFKDATTDPQQIADWRARFPAALIGVPMGHAPGVFAIDTDAPKVIGGAYGRIAWAELSRANGGHPDTHAHITPNGGMHILFRWRDDRPVTNARGLLPVGIDVRGEGGYVIRPPSRFQDGREYRVADPACWWCFAEAPDWLLEIILGGANKPQSASPNALVVTAKAVVPLSASPYVEACSASRVRRCRECSARRAQRTTELSGVRPRATGRRRRDSDPELVYLALIEAAGACGLIQEDGPRRVRATINSGLAAGRAKPRGVPDLPGDGRAPTRSPRVPIVATPYVWTDPRRVRPRDFLYGRHLIRGYISATVAPGGVGKSMLKTRYLLAMVLGRDLLEIGHTRLPLHVWYFNLEDPKDELIGRIQAVAMRYGLDDADFGGRLFVNWGRDQELIIAEFDARGKHDPSSSGR